MILTKNKILEAVRSGEIRIDPFDESALDAASYDMTLHGQIRVFIEGLNEIDLADMAQDAHALMAITRIVNIPADSYYLLKPGELVLGMTVEKLTLAQDIAGTLEGRSRFARMGLMVHVTASFLQPGIRNMRQVFEIFNASRNAIRLRSGIRMARSSSNVVREEPPMMVSLRISAGSDQGVSVSVSGLCFPDTDTGVSTFEADGTPDLRRSAADPTGRQAVSDWRFEAVASAAGSPVLSLS